MKNLFVSILCFLFLFSASAFPSDASKPAPVGDGQWIQAGINSELPRWGVQGGLVWGIYCDTAKDGEPIGLIRLYYPTLPEKELDLINFIAVEPTVRNRRGFSEMEKNEQDGTMGKRFRVFDPKADKVLENAMYPGIVDKTEDGRERLTVHLDLEKFQNGAHVRLKVVQYQDNPDEIELTLNSASDSERMSYCVLTATMGNKARARLLWLKNRVENSLKLYPDFKESHFANSLSFPKDDLFQDAKGNTVVAITTDEADPAQQKGAFPYEFWKYLGKPVTQYWKKTKGTAKDDLQSLVNGRYTYWMSDGPIPGGIAFENFEMMERFYEGQQFIIGITFKTPQELGFPKNVKPE